MVRRVIAVVVLIGSLVVVGCGPNTQKGVNKDYDRPKTPDTRK